MLELRGDQPELTARRAKSALGMPVLSPGRGINLQLRLRVTLAPWPFAILSRQKN